ncbi:MAG TPA: hypothetical protein VMH00_05495 [Candidatus Limnocylindrales bacterium]|nr:hypothetical protein [Candidatus Limnocylindrales bacterium]
MKTLLPNFESLTALFVDCVRTASFDQLDALFQACICGGSQHHVKMIRHDDEFVEQKRSSVAMVQNRLQEDLGDFRHLEGMVSLPALCGHEV